MANKINDNNNSIAKTRYTHRDYETIKKDLIDLIPFSPLIQKGIHHLLLLSSWKISSIDIL